MGSSSFWIRATTGLVLISGAAACAAGVGGDGPTAGTAPALASGGAGAGAGGTGIGSAGTGSAGIGSAGAGTGNGYAATVQPLFKQACNCHQSTPYLMAPFSLKPGEAYGNLVNVPAMQLKTMVLVKPNSLDQSYLWHKVNDTQLSVGGMGKVMPSTIPLNAEEKTIVERWILGGALP